jgi:hypothetical protein
MKAVWEQRVRDIRARGVTPIFDVESSYNPFPGGPGSDGDGVGRFLELGASADELGLAVVAFEPLPGFFVRDPSVGIPPLWAARASRKLVGSGTPWFMPVPPANQLPPERAATYPRILFPHILREGYPLMGEYFFRHYPSDRQSMVKETAADFDFDVPFDGPVAEELLVFSARHGLPFMIHYEVEDRLLPVLEEALVRHPGAKVIWAHFGRVRMPDRGASYGPERVEAMIRRCPNLYFDTSDIWRLNRYPGSGAYSSVLWGPDRRHLDPAWKALVERHPWRFLSALDMGSDRMTPETNRKKVAEQRAFLAELSPRTAQIVAYGAAWKLIFGEDLVGPVQGPEESGDR